MHDNTIYYGTASETWVNYGIWLDALAGQNLSNGNIFRENSVTGINVDEASNAVYCGFHVVKINGTEFCDNTVDQSYIGMHFRYSNNIDLRTSHFNNHTYGLRITESSGKIGEQNGTGNDWGTDDCVEFAAQNLSGNPMNSEILVTQGNTLPWLPDHDKIDPDPTIGAAWFHESIDDDHATCLSPLETPLVRKITPSEREAVLNTSTLSGVYLWDLKRDAYTKLLLYSELRPASSPQETFFNGLNGTLIDSLAQVTLQVINGLSLSSGDQTDFDTYRSDIEQAFEDLVNLDESLDYSDLDNLTGTWFSDRETLLQLIASNAADDATLESTRNAQVSADLGDALTYNASITTVQPYGVAGKTINELRISRLLALPMTETLYDDALALAQEDENDTGASTNEAVRFLGPCDQGEYLDKEEYPVEERGEGHKSHQPVNGSMQVVPNPTSGLTDIRLPENNGGLLTVHNVQGQKIKTRSVVPGELKASLDLGQFPIGLYLVVFSNEAGIVLGTVKVFVTR